MNSFCYGSGQSTRDQDRRHDGGLSDPEAAILRVLPAEEPDDANLLEFWQSIMNGRPAKLMPAGAHPHLATVGAITVAAFYSQCAVIELLFSHGAKLSASAEALMVAAHSVDVELVKLLLREHGNEPRCDQGVRELTDTLRCIQARLDGLAPEDVGRLRTGTQCAALVEDALSAARRSRARRRWRLAISVVAELKAWHMRRPNSASNQAVLATVRRARILRNSRPLFGMLMPPDS